MNDFTDIENELKNLQPAKPSPRLLVGVEKALANSKEEPRPARRVVWRPEWLPQNWLKLGLPLAAAAVLLLLARIESGPSRKRISQVAQVSPSEHNEANIVPETSASPDEFIPAGLTQVVYNTRNEGLQFAEGYDEPLRQVRYQTHETLRWSNPATGASLRVSYPREEIVLIPVSGQ